MKTFFLAIGGLLLAANFGSAGLVSPQSILDLEQSADLIVVATASGTYSAGAMANFSLQVNRVLKGSQALGGSSLSVYWPTGPAGLLGPRSPVVASMPTGGGIWFLRFTSNQWQLIPVLNGAVPMEMTFYPASVSSLPDAYAYLPTASLSDKIASEISAAVDAANGAFNFQLYLLQYNLLDQLNSPVVKLLYGHMAVSSTPQQQILGLAGLIRLGDVSSLLAAAQSAQIFENYAIENGILLSSLRESFRGVDAASVAALGESAQTTTSSVFRECAAHALAAVHTVATLPYLAALLDDADENVRVEAIGGIGAFANGLPSQVAVGNLAMAHLQLPATAPYKTQATVSNFAMGSAAIGKNEASYLSFWKNWWSQNHSALGY